MSQHTPGPWKIVKKMPVGGGIGIGPEIEGIGPHAVVTFNGGESEANARLIAKAPEMYNALQAIANMNITEETNFPQLLALCVAIAKTVLRDDMGMLKALITEAQGEGWTPLVSGTGTFQGDCQETED